MTWVWPEPNDWLATDEGHDWITATFERTHCYAEGFFQFKDDHCADPARWPEPRSGDDIDEWED